LLNSRKRQRYTLTDSFECDSVFQWRVRTWTVDVLYRFNQKKSERGPNNNRGGGYDDEGFEG